MCYYSHTHHHSLLLAGQCNLIAAAGKGKEINRKGRKEIFSVFILVVLLLALGLNFQTRTLFSQNPSLQPNNKRYFPFLSLSFYMDFHLKPWRDQQQHQLESEATEQNQQEEVEQSSVSSASANAASTPKLFLESPYSQPSSSSTAAAAGGSATTTLPLFVPEGGGVQQQQQEEEVKEEQDSAHPLTKFTNLSSAFTSSDHHSAPCRFPSTYALPCFPISALFPLLKSVCYTNSLSFHETIDREY